MQESLPKTPKTFAACAESTARLKFSTPLRKSVKNSCPSYPLQWKEKEICPSCSKVPWGKRSKFWKSFKELQIVAEHVKQKAEKDPKVLDQSQIPSVLSYRLVTGVHGLLQEGIEKIDFFKHKKGRGRVEKEIKTLVYKKLVAVSGRYPLLAIDAVDRHDPAS
ncbi:MAG: hypothetical protein ACE5DI_02655 [Candidatus Micrarchaeia archaeon]